MVKLASMPKSLADKLREAIRAEMAKGTSLREIARRADVTHTAIRRFADGNGGITLESAESLAKALGVKMEIKN